VNGVVAAKAAQMQVIAVPDPDHRMQKQFALADFEANTFNDALNIIKSLVP
jgi:beta-phosphoglucomutase-like phosphatase (HAD superfamily)